MVVLVTTAVTNFGLILYSVATTVTMTAVDRENSTIIALLASPVKLNNVVNPIAIRGATTNRKIFAEINAFVFIDQFVL